MKTLLLLAGCAGISLAAAPRMVPHPEVTCTNDQTLVWTAAMQASFDRLMGSKASMRLQSVDPPNPIIERMNAFEWKEADVLPTDGWFAVAGESGQALADKATVAWRKLAGPDATPFEPSPSAGLTAYAGIKRDFSFTKAFKPSHQQRLPWGDARTPVKFFGANGTSSEDYASSVRVLAYRPFERAMALQFTAKHGDDTLVLYMPREPQSMLEAMRWTQTWRNAWNTKAGAELAWDDKFLHRGDDLRVPEIDLKLAADLTASFAGTLRFKKNPQLWLVNQAKSDVRLSIDATGVKFQATASMSMVPFSVEPAKPYPRKFWFDRPFFVFLWRDGAPWPYAAVWCGDDAALVK